MDGKLIVTNQTKMDYNERSTIEMFPIQNETNGIERTGIKIHFLDHQG